MGYSFLVVKVSDAGHGYVFLSDLGGWTPDVNEAMEYRSVGEAREAIRVQGLDDCIIAVKE